MKPFLKFDHGMKEKPTVTNIEKRINVEMKNITIPRLMNDTTSKTAALKRSGSLVGHWAGLLQLPYISVRFDLLLLHDHSDSSMTFSVPVRHSLCRPFHALP